MGLMAGSSGRFCKSVGGKTRALNLGGVVSDMIGFTIIRCSHLWAIACGATTA